MPNTLVKQHTILICDKNSTWIDSPENMTFAKSLNIEIKAVGRSSSGLDMKVDDHIIYQTASENGWSIVTRDKDFLDVAKRFSNTIPFDLTPYTFLIGDEVGSAQEIFLVVEKALKQQIIPEQGFKKLYDCYKHFPQKYQEYLDLAKRIKEFKAKNLPTPHEFEVKLQKYQTSGNCALCGRFCVKLYEGLGSSCRKK